MRQKSIFTHMLIKCIDTLFGTQHLRLSNELSFQFLAERVAFVEIHQAAAGRRAVTNRHPRREELGVPAPQEELVVVDPGAEASGAIVPQHGAVNEDFLVPAREVTHEAAEGWVREEAPVGWCCVNFIEELEDLGLRGAAKSLVREGVVGRVEDAVAGVGAWEEDPGW